MTEEDERPDPALADGKGFPLRMFAPTVTEIELTAVSHANVPLCICIHDRRHVRIFCTHTYFYLYFCIIHTYILTYRDVYTKT